MNTILLDDAYLAKLQRNIETAIEFGTWWKHQRSNAAGRAKIRSLAAGRILEQIEEEGEACPFLDALVTVDEQNNDAEDEAVGRINVRVTLLLENTVERNRREFCFTVDVIAAGGRSA